MMCGMNTEAIRAAAAKVGGQATLARHLNVKPPVVNQWVKGLRRVPAEQCPRIESFTEGAVRCEQLRPDVAWGVLRVTTVENSGTRA